MAGPRDARLHASDIAMPEGAAGPAAIERARQPDPTFWWMSGWLRDAGRLAVRLTSASVRFRFPGQKLSIRRPEMMRLSEAAGIAERELNGARVDSMFAGDRHDLAGLMRHAQKNARIGGSLYRRNCEMHRPISTPHDQGSPLACRSSQATSSSPDLVMWCRIRRRASEASCLSRADKIASCCAAFSRI